MRRQTCFSLDFYIAAMNQAMYIVCLIQHQFSKLLSKHEINISVFNLLRTYTLLYGNMCPKLNKGCVKKLASLGLGKHNIFTLLLMDSIIIFICINFQFLPPKIKGLSFLFGLWFKQIVSITIYSEHTISHVTWNLQRNSRTSFQMTEQIKLIYLSLSQCINE